MLPGILNQLGAESLTHLKRLASNVGGALVLKLPQLKSRSGHLSINEHRISPDLAIIKPTILVIIYLLYRRNQISGLVALKTLWTLSSIMSSYSVSVPPY